ncbi:leucine-rich repeat domain-containing protein [Paenibacillus sp. FSL R7-0337]|uniref:leucine-rich repeat domain-containing protein n=1 Tax=Paenibacillus sp. FSL R7-0337 TaxID=1926588 RepID=UPI00096CC67D|nr:leucine-rich repeat domain-containing protein [Paenibacillus sp. FSL R7-0337]OMG00513.1 hypothetical protein BK147_04775 [Paenibacillus sp. FSL R7-0337]
MQFEISLDFADERFREFVKENFCGERESIRKSDIDSVTTLNLGGRGISSLQGIEHFTALQELDCSRNSLRTLDLSRNTKLEKLECQENMISALDLRSNPGLTLLQCCYNSLHELNLEHNTALEQLDCSSNYIITLNIAECKELVEIRCNHNHLTRLETSNHPRLTSLRCFNNHVTGLDLSHNVKLTKLYCSENKLTVLDTSHNPQLVELDYANNLITQPDHEVEGVGTLLYDTTFTCYSAILSYSGHELPVTAEVKTKTEAEHLTSRIQKVWGELDKLLDLVLQQIAEAHPDEDVNELELAELIFTEDYSFRIGYDAGDTPAGRLCIYAAFDPEGELDPELIYEMY